MRRPYVFGLLTALGLIVSAVLAAQQQSAPPQQPTFRSRTTLMTVEVRVVDQKGRPITGLTQDDFTISENGAPQKIDLFVPITLTPGAPGEVEGPPALVAGARPSNAPSTRRIFLIALGGGNLQVPSKGLDGVIHLVRDLLLPQDLVAVLAWNRGTDFTTNHEQIAQMLERYKEGHQKVQMLMAQHFSGLAAIYGSRDIPPSLQGAIDAVLRGPDAPATRALLSDPNATGIEAGVRRVTDTLQNTASLDVFSRTEQELIGMSLDEYASTSVQSMQDLSRIYAGLSYLRHMDGEKHLFFVSGCGLNLPSTDDDKSLARVAQDARVAIDIFHSAGICGGWWSVPSSENIAEYTGGQFTGLTYGAKFADKVDAATRTAYQLGYYPTNPALDGKYRKLSVKVNRRGAQALFRHGYYANEIVAALDRRQVIVQSRVNAAMRYGGDVQDLHVTATATRGKTKTGKLEIVLQLNVAPDGISLTELFREEHASLDLAAFCADRGPMGQYRIVGQGWSRVDFGMATAQQAIFRARGVDFTVHVPISRSVSACKVVVYDYGSDRVGTAVPKIK